MQKIIYKSLVIFLLFGIITSCEKKSERAVEGVEYPETIDIDVDNDGIIDFVTQSSVAVGDGFNHVSYHYILGFRSVNSETAQMLRSYEYGAIFLSEGDTININDTQESFWSTNGLSYASKITKSTNNHEVPNEWIIYTRDSTKQAIVAYRLKEENNDRLLGFIKFEIDKIDGSIDIQEISKPALTDHLIID